MKKTVAVFWFRRDLRIEDNVGFYEALRSNDQVLPLFIFDPDILDPLEDRNDPRVTYMHQRLELLNEELMLMGSCLWVIHDQPINAFKQLIEEFSVQVVYTNNDYEPYAIKRDAAVRDLLKEHGVAFHGYKDQVIFEKDEILKSDGRPYTVFTSYSRRWKCMLSEKPIQLCEALAKDHLLQCEGLKISSLESLGFTSTERIVKPIDLSLEMLSQYELLRNIPAVDATSHLSVALRFGTISIRRVVLGVKQYEHFLNELIWREFFMQVLYHYPNVVWESFKPDYDRIEWVNDEECFLQWCEGRTGFPMVDAGMRELNETGMMNNRVRMVTASFLTKHLLIDWRWGEAYFARKLMDYELSSNNGNWQWVAGTGCDAAPYFRIFNPEQQLRRFDPEEKYIRRWIPEYGTSAYPHPMVDLGESRLRTLSAYKQALNRME